jgi:transcription antitermination factor NusB
MEVAQTYKNLSTRGRTRARRYALQALYQWQITTQDVREIDRQFVSGMNPAKVDLPYFRELLYQVPERIQALDEALTLCLDRPLENVDPVERAVLRIGAYELKYRLDIPHRVVINEAVELAKVFGAEQGHRYVNGVLDKLARELRPG